MAIIQRTLTAVATAAALAGAFTAPVWAQTEVAQLQSAKADWATVHAARAEHLKTILQIQPQQETAWHKYVQATTPEQREPRAERGQRENLRKMSTPERVEKAQQLRKARNAKAEQHEKATLTFYKSLNTSQQKAFDAITAQSAKKHHSNLRASHANKQAPRHGQFGHSTHPMHAGSPAN